MTHYFTVEMNIVNREYISKNTFNFKYTEMVNFVYIL